MEFDVFKRSHCNFKKLTPYGFNQTGDNWILEHPLMDGAFRAVVTITPQGTVSGKVYDADFGEEYLALREKGQRGGFVQQVREAYKALLEDIREHCFEPQYFVLPQANRLAAWLEKHYGTVPEFPWDDLPGAGVFRHGGSRKWYGLIMYIDRKQLKDGEGGVEVINLKADPALERKGGIYPAYHMNKKHWISVLLDDTLTDAVVHGLVESSYELTGGKASAARKSSAHQPAGHRK